MTFNKQSLLPDENQSRILILAIFCLGVFAVYFCSFGHEFIINWDDDRYVVNNQAVLGLSWEHLKIAFTSYFVGNYAPLHIISYMIDYELWGMTPAGFIGTNLLLHALNGVLFYLLLEKIFKEQTIPTVATFIFLFHPVQVESVVWISQRKNLLSMFFFLMALKSYSSYRDNGRTDSYIVSVIAFILALLSKSVAIVFPVVAVLYDYCHGWPLSRFNLRDKLPYAAAAIGMAYLTIISQKEQGTFDYPGGTLLTTLYTMLPVLAGYLRECLAPVKLSPYYMVPAKLHADTAVLLSGCLLIMLAALAVLLWRKNRQAFFWYAVFFVGLLPVSQIVPMITLKNDRYLYFPMVGFATVAAMGLAAGIRRIPSRRGTAWGVAIVMLLTLPILTVRQAGYWKDPITLWEHAVRVDPDDQLGWHMLVTNNTLKGNGPAAIKALENLTRLQKEHGQIRGWGNQ